jgi:hypothetical protein
VVRAIITMLIISLIAGLGCTTPSSEPKSSDKGSTKTTDGLVEVEIEMPGVLFLRDNHGIGSYDAFLIPPADIDYRRRSSKLSSEMEDEFLAQLEQALIDNAGDNDIPIEQTPGQCVMAIAVALINVDIERSSSSKTLGSMTLVMEFRDSMSRQTLLRYATQNRIESGDRRADRSRQLRDSFDQMLERMDISGAFRAAGLADDEIRPGCQGTLAERGRAAQSSFSAH